VKCLSVRLLGDYFIPSEFNYENTQRLNEAGRLINNYNQALAGFNVSFGVAYVFGNNLLCI